MGAQVENNVKKNKQRTEKKKTHMYRIESLKTWGTAWRKYWKRKNLI